MDDFNEPFVAFSGDKVKKKTHVVWGIIMLTKKIDSVQSVYLPGYDIYYSAKDDETARKKAIALTQVYFRHFVNRKNGIGALALELHRLGFKAPKDALTLSRLLKREISDARFKSTASTPDDFMGASMASQHMEMEMEMEM